MCLYVHPLGKEGRKGGGEIKHSIHHLPQKIAIYFPWPLLLANIICEGSHLIPEKRSRPIDPSHSGCISKGTVTNTSVYTL